MNETRRFLVIEPSARGAVRLREMLRDIYPQAEADWYDPTTTGETAPTFDWAMYDAVLLAQSLRLPGVNGVAWLSRFLKEPGVPPILFLARGGEQSMALSALKGGAVDYLERSKITRDALKMSLDEALTGQTMTGTLEASQLFTSAVPQTDHSYTDDEQPRTSEGTATPGRSGNDTGSRLIKDRPIKDRDVYRDSGRIVPIRGMRGIEVPGYRVIKRAGEGGMASVFLAERLDDGLEVVLKVVYIHDESDPRDLRRFMREYNLIGQLDHPNVVHIYERAFAADYAYIAMEYFDGGDLTQRISAGIGHEEALKHLRDMAMGLGATHEHDIVHRDMKPANVLFRSGGGLAISDFGISTELGSTRSITMAGQVMGTPQYMSPEQIHGRDADPRTDIYALGVILFEMLTGQRPYENPRLSKLMYAHLSEPIPRMPAEHAELQPLVDRLMAKQASDRPQSAKELIEILDGM